MDDTLLGLLGLCLRAGKLEVGEDLAREAAKSRKARLVLLAADAADAVTRKAQGWQTDNCPVLTIPRSREELGGAVGRGSCAVCAVTEVGFASALVQKLAQAQPETYGETAAALSRRAEKAVRRRREKRSLKN